MILFRFGEEKGRGEEEMIFRDEVGNNGQLLVLSLE